jgi:hypothetical protein
MCNLYSITTNQAAIIALFRVVNRYVGNLAPMPGVFPDYKAPIVRNGAEGRELATARWGMPSSSKALVVNCRYFSYVISIAWMVSENTMHDAVSSENCALDGADRLIKGGGACKVADGQVDEDQLRHLVRLFYCFRP